MEAEASAAEVLAAEVFVEADLVGEVVDLVEVIEVVVHEGGLHLGGPEPGEP